MIHKTFKGVGEYNNHPLHPLLQKEGEYKNHPLHLLLQKAGEEALLLTFHRNH
jgi:hypothetical protein